MNTPPRTPAHAADRLLEAIERRGAPVCVGLDPVLEKLPEALRPGRRGPAAAASALASFCLGVLDAVAPIVPAVKLQAACFERFGHRRVKAAEEVVRAATARGLPGSRDAKRRGSALTAGHYAEAAWGPGGCGPGWMTINAYLGAGGIEPFLVAGRGAFALVRTSNPGGDAVQSPRLADGRSV